MKLAYQFASCGWCSPENINPFATGSSFGIAYSISIEKRLNVWDGDHPMA